MYILNNKNETIQILKKYFQKFNLNELVFYLENINNENIPTFLKKNTIDPDEIELHNLIQEHFMIVFKKIFYLTTSLNLIRNPIKISFVNSSIYCSNLFTIDNTIFINYSFLELVFEKIEYNLYEEVKQVYIENNKIYDIELLKNISTCIYSVLQYLNKDSWYEFIQEKFNCVFVDISEINFIKKYNIFKNPNQNFIWNKIPIYWIPTRNKPIALINSILSSELSFSPYWETILIELDYSNGIYTELNSNISNDLNSNIPNDLNLSSEPFIQKAHQITNCLIY